MAVPCPHGLGDGLNTSMLVHDVTSHDAAYLAIAVELRLPLATADRKLDVAARRERVPLFRDVYRQIDRP
jgi:hypothetical protein